MKILYDHQIFNSQIYGGISRYFYNIMNEFNKNGGVNFKLTSIYSHNEYLKKSNFKNTISFLNDKKFKGRDRLFDYFLNLNKLNSIFHLRMGCFDIFHPTEYDPYFLDCIGNKPFVLTVYDMIHEIYNKKHIQYIENKKKLIKKASKIIAISENTKKDILKFIDIPEDKIEVTYLASSFNTFSGSLLPKNAESVLLPEQFLLFVGNRGGYKNFDFFLKSIIPIFTKYSNLELVCVGGSLFTENEKEFIKRKNLSNRIIHLYINDNQLAYAYSKALAFIFPSLYEGFGIPILEAFGAECTLLLSNKSCFPEIALDAAIYFDPEDSESIVQAVEKVIIDKKLRSEKIEKGLIRLKDFSWQKTAEQTKQIYKSVL